MSRATAQQDLAEAQQLVDALTAEVEAVRKRMNSEHTRGYNALGRLDPALDAAVARRDYFAAHPDLPKVARNS